jgi:phage terminase small subunit
VAARSSGGRRRAAGERRPGHRPKPAAEPDRDEILERARGLGITPERVLQEYAHIAFADLRRVAKWGSSGLELKEPNDLADEDAAAISEVAGSHGSLRIKLYDKKAALDAIARHLGMFVRAPQRQDDGSPDDLAEDAREVLARRLARLAAGGAEE